MNNCSYTISKSSNKDILLHLKKCDNDYIPPLSSYVNICHYSNKIFINARTFEAWWMKELIGLLACYCNNTDSKTAFITNISVVKCFQGNGIAKKLLFNVMYNLKKNHWERVQLDVAENNKTAIKFYKKHNFHAVGQKDKSIRMERLV